LHKGHINYRPGISAAVMQAEYDALLLTIKHQAKHAQQANLDLAFMTSSRY